MAKLGRPRVPRAVRARFWDGVRSGLSLREAAAAAGVHRGQAEGWFREAGGVKGNGPVTGKGRYLSLAEREEIMAGLAAELSQAEIARRLGRRTGRALRKPRRTEGERRGRIPDMVSISARPAEAEDRAVPGHWEGDLIIGTGNTAIGTLVERSTRFVLLLHLPAGHDAAAAAAAMSKAAAALPAQLRRSLTWDQGKEMAAHRQVTMATGMQVYFCDPHSPWQRGSNENTNGLLRQYFPKGTSLAAHSRERLEEVAAELNGRPRKTLGWKTPAEAMAQLLDEPAA